MAILGSFVLVHLMGDRLTVRPLIVSKINTFLQIALAALALLRMGYDSGLTGLEQIGVCAVTASTLASGITYLVQWMRETGARHSA